MSNTLELLDWNEQHAIADSFFPTKELALAEGKKFLIANDKIKFDPDTNTNKIVKRYRGDDSITEIMAWYMPIPENQKHYYYCMTGEWIEFFDIDGKWSDEIFKDKTISDIKADFLYVRKLFLDQEIYTNSSADNETYYWENSSDEEKVSLHLTIRNGFKFANCNEIKSYTESFLSFIEENNYQIKFDKGIYNKDRLIRMVYSSKIGTNRVLIPDNKDAPLSLYFACNTFSEKIIERFDGEPMVTEKFITRKKNKDGKWEVDNTPIVLEDNELSRLIDLIYESVDNGTHSLCDKEITNRMCYSDWIKVAFAIIRVTDGNCKNEFNKIFELYRHCDEQSPVAMFKNMSRYRYGWTLSSLHRWAEENPRYIETFQRQSLLRKYDYIKKKHERAFYESEQRDYESVFDFNLFVDKLSSRTAIEKCFKDTVYQVQNQAQAFFITKVKNWNSQLQTYISGYQTHIAQLIGLHKITYIINPDYEKQLDEWLAIQAKKKKTKKDKEAKEPTPVIPIFIEGSTLKLPDIFGPMLLRNKIDVYDRIINEPYFITPPKHADDMFNLFKGFKLMINNEYFDNKTNHFEDSHFYANLFYLIPIKEQREFVLNMIAHSIQYPADLPIVCIFIYSLPGCGKDLFAEFWSYLVGPEYYHNFGNVSDYFDHFSSAKEGLLLTVINELAEGGTENMMFKKLNLFKDSISAPTIKIEKKCKDPYPVKNTVRALAFSNHENGMPMEPAERRILPIKSDNTMCNNQEHFEPIIAEIRNNLDFLQSAFSYFAHRDITGFNPTKIPNSKYKDDLKINQFNSPVRFVCSVFNEYNTPSVFYIQVADFYELYKHFCKIHGYKVIIRKNFLSNIAFMFEEYTVNDVKMRRTYNRDEVSIGTTINNIHRIIYDGKEIPNTKGYFFLLDAESINRKVKGYYKLTDFDVHDFS